MCLSKKILGGAHFSFYANCLEVCMRLQKNLGSRILIGRNILLKPFSCGWAFLHIFYIGIYWKIAKIAYFRIYEPLNVNFVANFIPYPKRLYNRDFLSQFWSFIISIPWSWGLWKGSKMVIFRRFSAEIAYFHIYEPLNIIFGANFIPYSKGL